MKLAEYPIICLGQDGVIFNYFISTNKMWTHKFKCRIVPKDEEYGIMISAF